MGQKVDGGWAGCLAKWMGGSNDETSKENKKLQQQWPKGMGQGEKVGGMQMNEPTNQLNESGSNNNCEDVAGDSCNCNQRQQQHQPSPGTGPGQEREFQVLVITPKWACPCQPIDTIFGIPNERTEYRQSQSHSQSHSRSRSHWQRRRCRHCRTDYSEVSAHTETGPKTRMRPGPRPRTQSYQQAASSSQRAAMNNDKQPSNRPTNQPTDRPTRPNIKVKALLVPYTQAQLEFEIRTSGSAWLSATPVLVLSQHMANDDDDDAHHLRFTINAATTTTTTHYSPHSFSFRTAKATIVPGGRGITGQQSLLLGRLCPAHSPRLPPPLRRMHKKPGEIIEGDPFEYSSFTVYPESFEGTYILRPLSKKAA
uniref:HDC13905 n=1 Tax=Drosophila melanogaster TaxID=7227 RepID=Q6IK03_DROME|nr:TPA_inf: HDC13905 [Drosophila melanogaster]